MAVAVPATAQAQGQAPALLDSERLDEFRVAVEFQVLAAELAK